MNRIDTTLAKHKASQQKVLSPYITAGDPEPGLTVQLMHALVKAGANILEIGIPFSDPMAEGPVIQAAMERALKHGVNCDDVLNMVEVFRDDDKETPVVLMGYLNPIEQYGYSAFASRAAHVGVDGIIIVDMPPEESQVMLPMLLKANIYPIYLSSPTTSNDRLNLIKSLAHGYVYYVSLKGVTGSSHLDLKQVKMQYQQVKSKLNLPVMVGFGIKNPEMAKTVASFADGVIVGAALVEQIYLAYVDKQDCVAVAGNLLFAMRSSMDQKETS